jgi:hypothetical protein
MSLTLRLSKWIRPDSKHSDCEIDLKFLDYSTRRRTELADEPACAACNRQVRTGEEPAKMVNQNSDFRQTDIGARAEQAAAFARRDSNQTGDPKLF